LPSVTVSEHNPLPALSTVAVRPASVVTDALNSFATAVDAATYAVTIPAGMVVSLPFNAYYAAASALQDPAAAGSVLSFLARVYLDASDNFTLHASTFPWAYKTSVLEPLLELLPFDWGTSNITALNNDANGVDAALNGLPDPWAGQALLSKNQFNTVLGRTLWAVEDAITAPMYATSDVVSWLGHLPALLEATAESAIQDPAHIPGTLSNLVHNAFDPYTGLTGEVALVFVNILDALPAPIGFSVGSTGMVNGLVGNAYAAIQRGVANLLKSILPTPVAPTPFASTAVRAKSAALAPSVATREAVVVKVRPHPEQATGKLRVGSDGGAVATARQHAGVDVSGSRAGGSRSGGARQSHGHAGVGRG
jgi:hypothetical protein